MPLFTPPQTTLARRIHSLSGVVPIGVFLVLHLFLVVSLLRGDAAFRSAVRATQGTPFLVELVLIVIPLAYHAIYGIAIAWQDRKSPSVFPTQSMAMLQRVTGVVAALFLALHIADTSYQKWFHGAAPITFGTMLEARLATTTGSIPWIALAYMIGIACTCFHFSAGVWSFSVSWKVARTDRARRRLLWTSAFAGVVLFGMAALPVVELATGTRIVDAPDPLPDGPDRPACPQ